ncbi:hypothetical protein [Ulvibacterium sp.]|uniref:hypothetical protein n=1 Tax=Ulvibacterium sp. TaxID=2665914 RepID=UPI003CC5DB9E
MSDPKKYVETLELDEGGTAISFLESGISSRLENGESTPEEAFTNFKSVNSFASGISKARQDDVLNSVLLAQKAAQKAFPEDNQIIDWHKKYFEVLSNIGWLLEGKDFVEYTSGSNIFEIDKAVLDILGAALTGSQLAIILKAIDSLKSLAKNDSRFIAFEKNTHSLSKGSFQMGLATEVEDTISINSSAFMLDTSNKINQILFFKSSKDKTSFKYKQYKATLIDEQYDRVRIPIKQKLGAVVDDYIADLEI